MVEEVVCDMWLHSEAVSHSAFLTADVTLNNVCSHYRGVGDGLVKKL